MAKWEAKYMGSKMQSFEKYEMISIIFIKSSFLCFTENLFSAHKVHKIFLFFLKPSIIHSFPIKQSILFWHLWQLSHNVRNISKAIKTSLRNLQFDISKHTLSCLFFMQFSFVDWIHECEQSVILRKKKKERKKGKISQKTSFSLSLSYKAKSQVN